MSRADILDGGESQIPCPYWDIAVIPGDPRQRAQPLFGVNITLQTSFFPQSDGLAGSRAVIPFAKYLENKA